MELLSFFRTVRRRFVVNQCPRTVVAASYGGLGMQKGERRTPLRTTRAPARSGAHAGAPPAPAPTPAWLQQLWRAQVVSSIGVAKAMARKQLASQQKCVAMHGVACTPSISTAILPG